MGPKRFHIEMSMGGLRRGWCDLAIVMIGIAFLVEQSCPTGYGISSGTVLTASSSVSLRYDRW